MTLEGGNMAYHVFERACNGVPEGRNYVKSKLDSIPYVFYGAWVILLSVVTLGLVIGMAGTK